jgi:hypothetical protein
MALIVSVAFDGMDAAEIATMNRVLSVATQRLVGHEAEQKS